MKEIMILIFILYVLPIVLAYLFVRKILIEDNSDPDLKDVLIPFIPSINIVLAVCYIMFIVTEFMEDKRWRLLMKKFYRLK